MCKSALIRWRWIVQGFKNIVDIFDILLIYYNIPSARPDNCSFTTVFIALKNIQYPYMNFIIYHSNVELQYTSTTIYCEFNYRYVLRGPPPPPSQFSYFVFYFRVQLQYMLLECWFLCKNYRVIVVKTITAHNRVHYFLEKFLHCILDLTEQVTIEVRALIKQRMALPTLLAVTKSKMYKYTPLLYCQLLE